MFIFLLIFFAYLTFQMAVKIVDRCVLAILRYIYIVHNEWMNRKWPEARQLRAIGLGAVFLLVSISQIIFFSSLAKVA